TWHYPSDVLGGFVMAGVWTLAGVGALSWLEDRRRATRPSPARSCGGQQTVAEALSPMALLILGALVSAAVLALARPETVVGYADRHRAFILGAAVIATLGLASAAAATLALRRPPPGRSQR
ncbi:MAG: hypothetical protein M3016_05760, partial [Actinomycetota bacterium]|nr:hypothetical protein [Actinomycetota bacterium]